MANARRCDRCRSFYLSNDSEYRGIVCMPSDAHHILDGKNYDLCDVCVGKLIRFLDGDETYDPNYYRAIQIKEVENNG